ncbi:MAG: hypothetical protein ISS92_02460 [Candidatus Omnitrophica bacterium]|nr:hypothetical protein [Candidatus Omnitrophota bacterium]
MKTIKVLIAFFLFFESVALCEDIETLAFSLKTPERLTTWMANNLSFQWTLPDKPKTSGEILASRSGDCDDFANLASLILDRMGISNDVIIIRFHGLRMGHAICAWKRADRCYSFISNQKLTYTRCRTREEFLLKFYPDYRSYRTL